MELALVFAIAYVLGIIMGIIFPHKPAGVLKIDHTNPEKDVYRFEIDDLDRLSRKTRIFLKIDHNAKLSQE